MGPVIVIVAGFLVAVYFFQIEVNNARLEADKQSQERVDTAQKALERTYKAIGGMSDQLIENVESLLKLRKDIDDDLQRRRTNLEDIEKNLKALSLERDKIEIVLREKEVELKKRDEELEKQREELTEKAKQLAEKSIELEKNWRKRTRFRKVRQLSLVNLDWNRTLKNPI